MAVKRNYSFEKRQKELAKKKKKEEKRKRKQARKETTEYEDLPQTDDSGPDNAPDKDPGE